MTTSDAAIPERPALTPTIMFTLLRQTLTQWSDDDAPRHGAALAFYSILSIGPLLLIVISLAGLAFGQEAASRHLLHELTMLIGSEGANTINDIVANTRNDSKSILAALIGFATLIVSATGFFDQLQTSLNAIWNIPKPKIGVMEFIRRRMLSFGMIIGICVLLLFSLVISAALSAMTDMFGTTLPTLGMQALNMVVSLIVTTVLFAMTFKVLPDISVAWRDVWIGAAITAVLFAIGKSLIGLYLGQSAFGSTYGAAGSLIVLLVWVYYSAQIFFFGAEFTQVYARHMGDRFAARHPAPSAVRS